MWIDIRTSNGRINDEKGANFCPRAALGLQGQRLRYTDGRTNVPPSAQPYHGMPAANWMYMVYLQPDREWQINGLLNDISESEKTPL